MFIFNRIGFSAKGFYPGHVNFQNTHNPRDKKRTFLRKTLARWLGGYGKIIEIRLTALTVTLYGSESQ